MTNFVSDIITTIFAINYQLYPTYPTQSNYKRLELATSNIEKTCQYHSTQKQEIVQFWEPEKLASNIDGTVVVFKWSACWCAFYSDDPSSNPAEVYNFSAKLLLKIINIDKTRPGLAHFKTLNADRGARTYVTETATPIAVL